MIKQKRAIYRPIAILLFIVAVLLLSACRSETAPPFITIGSDYVKLYVSGTETNTNLTSLKADGMQGQTATTFDRLPSDLTQGVGDKSERENKTYFAYSFNLFNVSDRAVSYECTINVTEHTGNILNAVRVLVVDGDKALTEGDIFAKPEATQAGSAALLEKTSYTTKPFFSDTVVGVVRRDGLGANSKAKVTIVVWFEGHDVDCNDAILGQSMSLSLSISAY